MPHRIFAVACLMFTAALALREPVTASQDVPDPHALLQRADELAWQRSWADALPLYEEAQRLFDAGGDRRNALYAEINALRGHLPRLAVPNVSRQLAAYLRDSLVQADDRLRLRALVIKGETDTDLDPVLAEQAWTEAGELAERIGESGWANRARGELGLVTFLQGDIGGAVIKLGQALHVARTNGDVPSVVRWLTLFGHGYMQLRRPEEALNFYDQALAATVEVPELDAPLMTQLGKGSALTALGRVSEARSLLRAALETADERGALGYQAELSLALARIADDEGKSPEALRFMSEAADVARRAGAGRIVAEVALQRAGMERDRADHQAAAATLEEGIASARTMQERILLPRLLAARADLHASEQQYDAAARALDEATDILEGLFASASSPWAQSRLVGGMEEVFVAHIALERARGPDPHRLFSILERARGRSLLELLVNIPMAEVERPEELRAGERRIAALQTALFAATDREERQALLDELVLAEQRLAPATTVMFDRSRRSGDRPAVQLDDVRAVLEPTEVFVEFVLAEPDSYGLVVTSASARVVQLPSRPVIEEDGRAMVEALREGGTSPALAQRLGATLVEPLTELTTASRLIVSPDGELHQLPFELLVGSSGRPLLETHVVSYTPSGSVLTVLRSNRQQPQTPRDVLAVSASSDDASDVPASVDAIDRSLYGLDGATLRPLAAANDEARSVGAILGPSRATLLLGEHGTERMLKRLPLTHYQVVHFAVHGIPSRRFPGRAALLLRPDGDEDGILQAREVLGLRFAADLITLAACDTASGGLHGQDGVLSLVRPFLAAGAGAVVANLWAADDTFSLTLMREFYRQLAAGVDIADSLRRAKLVLRERFGPEAVPRLWSGVVVYGDGTATVAHP